MHDKPLWLSYAVDFAQIGSAIFTAAAVLVAIWLARRGEMQRPKLRVGIHISIDIKDTVSMECAGGASYRERSGDTVCQDYALSLTIVNAGVLPILVRNADFYVRLPKSDSWGLGLGTFDSQANRQTFPLKLEHGQEVTVLAPVRKGERPWNAFPSLWWLRLRPEFRVTTSLGKTFRVKPGRRLLYRLNRDVLR